MLLPIDTNQNCYVKFLSFYFDSGNAPPPAKPFEVDKSVPSLKTFQITQ